jgi:hypothetical protein
MTPESTIRTDSDSLSEPDPSIRTLEMAREKCQQAIEYGFEQSHPVLVDALPAMGKSSGVIRWAKGSGQRLTVLTERHDLYHQYIEWCENHGLSVIRLPSFQHDCPTVSEKQENGRLAEEIETLYRAGIGGKEIHTNLIQFLGHELPCQQDGVCPYISRLEFDPDEVDILVGHYRHARASQHIQNRYVVFDEFPGDSLLETYSSDKISASVTHFLEANEELPFETYTDLIEYRRVSEHRSRSIEWFEEHPSTWSRAEKPIHSSRDAAHVMGPIFAYALLVLNDLRNG